MFRKLIRKKNKFLGDLKTNFTKLLFDKKNNNIFNEAKISQINKVVFLRHDNKIGDMIVSTFAYREMKKANPNLNISVIAGPNTVSIIENNTNVDKTFVFPSPHSLIKIIRIGKTLQKEKFDLYIDLDEKVSWKTIFLLWLIKPKFALGFNREKYKSYNLNIPFDFDLNHKIEHYKRVFEVLNLKISDTNYDIFIPENISETVISFLKSLPENRKNIVINPFGASKHRWMNFEQIEKIATEFSNCNIIIIGLENDLKKFLMNKKLHSNIFIPAIENYNIFHSFIIIKNCDFVITVDTSILHSAVAFQKPLVGLYIGTENKNTNMNIWGPGPNAKKNQIVLSGENSFDIFEISPDKIIAAIKKLFDNEDQNE